MLRRFAFFCGCGEHVQWVHHRPPCGVRVRCKLFRHVARSCFIRCGGATAQWSERSKFGTNDSFWLTSLTVEPLEWSTRWFVRAAPQCAQAVRDRVPAAFPTTTEQVRTATTRVFIKSNSRLIDHCTLQQRSLLTYLSAIAEYTLAGMSSRFCLLVQWAEQSLYVSTMITADWFERLCGAHATDSNANCTNNKGFSWYA